MVAAVAPVAGVNPVTAQIPGYVLAQMQAQRQQQLAAALSEQGMQPLDYDPRGRASWTQGLAKALQSGLGAYMGKQAMTQQAGLQQQGMQATAAALGMGQPGAAPAVASGPSPQALGAALDPRASAALAQGAQAGSIGPTNANAATMNAMPAPAPQAPAASAPGQGSGPLNPMGLPGMLIWSASQGDPAAQEQLKTLLANRQTTPEQKNWNAQGVDPTQLAGGTVLAGQRAGMTDLEKLQDAAARAGAGTPNSMQDQSAIAKANYIAPIEVKAGNLTMTPDGKTPLAYNPGLDKGINPTWSTSPDGYTTATGAAPVSGYAPSVASITGADQRARQDNTLTTVPDASGAQHTVWGNGQPFGSAPGAPGASTAPPQFNLQGTPAQQIGILSDIAARHADPAVRAAAGARIAQIAGGGPAPTAAPQQPQLGVGPGTTDASIQKSASDAIASAPQQLQASKSAITGLESALRVLPSVRATGPGTAATADVLAKLRNAGLPIPDDGINNYQTLSKYLGNSLNAAANGSSAGGSDARFESFMHGQPNADTMDKGSLDGAIRYVLSQHDAAAARAQFLPGAYAAAKSAGDPNAAQTAQTQWAQAYNPQVFAFNRMSPADRQQFKASLPPDQQAQFGQQYNAAHARGWVQ